MKLPLTISLLTVAAVTSQELKPNQCVISGCSGQICASKSRMTTCEWREEYACYKGATCEIQDDGLCGWTMTDELKTCLNPVVKPNECMKTGCSGQICSDQDIMTTCEWREEYACYGGATCERQADGQCGWTQTEELQSCLNVDTNTTLKPCVVGGCSGQICGEEDPDGGLISTCEWKEEYACYSGAACERQADGQCGWTPTKELEKCISNSGSDVEAVPVDELETSTTPEDNTKSCMVGGCSDEICGEFDSDGLISSCIWREEYTCYGRATCERQEDGQCGWTMTKELEECLATKSESGEEVEVEVAPAEDYETNIIPEDNTCRRTGCSGQVCSDEDVMTTCEWRDEYVCYGSATCERQADGQCGWTMTKELEECFSNSGSDVEVGVAPVDGSETNTGPEIDAKACVRGGCSGEICGEFDSDGLISSCIWREEYACYGSATCERQENGQCGWTMTKELEDCLATSSGSDVELALDDEPNN